MATPESERMLPIIIEGFSLCRQCREMLCNGVTCFLRNIIFTNAVNCFNPCLSGMKRTKNVVSLVYTKIWLNRLFRHHKLAQGL